MDAETLYRQMGRLIEAMPNFAGFDALTPEQFTWLGRASALIDASGDTTAKAEADLALNRVQGPYRHEAIKALTLVLFKVLARAELQAPPGAQGAFIPAGSRFDAFAAVTKVLLTANSDILIVDPYMDEVVLTDFAGAIADGIQLRLLADQASVKASFSPAALRWAGQHGSAKPLSARLAPPKALHDRAIFVDRTHAWLLTQSLKDLASRSPAEIVRADDTADLKIAAYEVIWTSANVII